MAHIGVLALQGDYALHLAMFGRLACDARPFRELSELPNLAGLVIPGGESTTIGMLMERRGLLEPLRQAIASGLPVFGTCAGAILLSRDIKDSDQVRLGVLDAQIQRNAYGTQVDSFEAAMDIKDPQTGRIHEIEGVFIRAPIFLSLGQAVEVLGEFNGHPTLLRQSRILAATFHPELTTHTGLHRYFAQEMCGLSIAG